MIVFYLYVIKYSEAVSLAATLQELQSRAKRRPNLHMTDIPEHRGPIRGRGGIATGLGADQSERALEKY